MVHTSRMSKSDPPLGRFLALLVSSATESARFILPSQDQDEWCHHRGEMLTSFLQTFHGQPSKTLKCPFNKLRGLPGLLPSHVQANRNEKKGKGLLMERESICGLSQPLL